MNISGNINFYESKYKVNRDMEMKSALSFSNLVNDFDYNKHNDDIDLLNDLCKDLDEICAEELEKIDELELTDEIDMDLSEYDDLEAGF